MTKEREELIGRFQKWLDTEPSKLLIAAECANIAEEYALIREQLAQEDVEFRNRYADLVCDRLLNHNPAGKFGGEKMQQCADLMEKGKQLEVRERDAWNAARHMKPFESDNEWYKWNTIEDWMNDE